MDPWPDHERRTEDRPDTGDRRRQSDTGDYSTVDLVRLLRAHEQESREWRARQDQRLRSVENRADLLDGSAGNDGGIIGQMGELRGELRAARQDLADLKAKTGAVDGQKPETRLQRGLAIAIPVLIAVLPVLGTIVVAWLALKGQIANVGGK